MKHNRFMLHRLIVVVLALLLATACRSTPASPTIAPVVDTAQPPAVLPAPGTESAPTPAPANAATPSAALTPPPAAGQPNRVVIPKIALDAPIVDVGWQIVERGQQRFTEWQTADNAVGHHINSAQPGEAGNVVLSGHHNTKGEVFRRISEQELAMGDAIYLYDARGQRFTYQVTEVTPPLLEVGATEEQRLANARYIQPTTDARVTLVTCWPYWTNTHRVVVVATLVQ